MVRAWLQDASPIPETVASLIEGKAAARRAEPEPKPEGIRNRAKVRKLRRAARRAKTAARKNTK